MQRIIIFANGELPDLNKARLLLRAGDRVICADGGTRHALALGVKPDLIIGSSVGAMVGALSASGLSAAELEQLSEKIRVADFFELGMIGVGKASGAATQNYVNEHVGSKTIEQLKTM